MSHPAEYEIDALISQYVGPAPHRILEIQHVALSPRQKVYKWLHFCGSRDEWFPTVSLHWDIKPNNILEKIFRRSLAQATTVADVRTLEGRFLEQAEKWDRETAHLSSPTQRFANPSYQAILGMGNDHREEVVDLLLRDMQNNRREWFWALSYLTHENPIERKDAGKLDKMIDAWVRWGQRRRGDLR